MYLQILGFEHLQKSYYLFQARTSIEGEIARRTFLFVVILAIACGCRCYVLGFKVLTFRGWMEYATRCRGGHDLEFFRSLMQRAEKCGWGSQNRKGV